MSVSSRSLDENAYAILVRSKKPGSGAFQWCIVESRTREPVEESPEIFRTMDSAFGAAGPALRRWLSGRAQV